MLINFSNHPSEFWGVKQIEAARIYGELKDIPFPMVSPEADYEEIQLLADFYAKKILVYTENSPITVHVMGEMTFVYRVISLLKEQGITCIASTTERDAEMTNDGKKISDFQFVRFRKY